MANASYIQTSFGSGEWSPSMQGRMDRPDYRQAMAACLNSLPLETEAWTRRPGMLLAGFTRGGSPGVLRRFEFKEAAPYNMEFTDGHLRFWSGLSIVTTNDDQQIASISTANPASVATTLAHNWSTGDQVLFRTLSNPDGLLLGRLFSITKTGASSFTLADAVTSNGVDGSALVAFGSGFVSRVLDIATSYAGSSWASLRSVQAQKQAVLLNGSSPQVLSVITDPGASTPASFGLVAANFIDGPYLDPPANSSGLPSAAVTPNASQGNVGLTFAFQAYSASVSYSVDDYATSSSVNYKSLQNANLNNTPASSPTFWKVVTGADPVSPNGFTSQDIGRHVRLFSEPALWVAATTYAALALVAYQNVYWQALVGSNTGNIPGIDATKWAVVSGQQIALWTWGRIIALGGGGVTPGTAISGATGANIGTLTLGLGGLAASFDGTLTKVQASSSVGALPGGPATCYIGKNYSGGAQQIAQAVVYPSTDLLFGCATTIFNTACNIVLNLRAKQTAPASSADGTLLGTSGSFANVYSPITITSGDQSTSWNYVWIEIIVTYIATPASRTEAITAQVIFATPATSVGATVTVQIAGPALLYTTPIRTWRAGVYAGTTWPKCGTYHEGRLWLSGAVDNRFDASCPNNIFNFAPTAVDGTVTDANGIDYTLNGPGVNPIFWMAPRQEGIVCGTQAGEWLVQATAQNQPLTPSNCQAHQYTSIKCANIEPAQCEHTLVFVQKHKRRLMEYFADIFSGKFAAPNLTIKAKHLTKPGIAEVRYQQDDMPVLWMRMADNSLVGLTYKRDSLVSKDGPTIAAAHRHTHGAARTVESLAVGPDGDAGELEALSLITTNGTYRYVEVMGQPLDDDGDLSDVQCLDGALTPTVYTVGPSSITIYGLYALNGISVSIMCGGLDLGTVTPANGAATILYGDGIGQGPGPAGYLFTLAFVNAFGSMPIVVGYPYTSQAQLLRPNTPQESGARQGPAFGKVRRSHRVTAALVNVLNGTLYFGTAFTKLMPANFKIKNGPKYDQGTLFTGTYKESLKDGGDPLDSMLCWQVTGPGPATVAAAGTFLDTEDE